jgi:RimJ/RimL family protein N-acetyltransferase
VQLETGRLLLRPISTDDLDQFVALHDDPEVTRHITRFDRPAAEERLRANDREWEERGHGLLAVIDKENGEFLGRTGLKHWPQFGEVGETEIGWALRHEAWGQGYATEAATACLEWAFSDFDFDYVTAMIGAGNDRSVRVAARLGFTPIREDIVMDVPVTVYAKRRSSVAALDPLGRV